MAHAFEKRVLRSAMMQELLLLFSPPKQPVFRGPVTADSRNVYSRWILPSGQEELANLPSYQETDRVAVPIELPDGSQISFELQLPFGLRSSASGPPRLLADRHRRIVKDRDRLLSYLSNLVADPTQNTGLAQFLEETGG
jgi:hypothetical protein